jgi:hypothetical protein
MCWVSEHWDANLWPLILALEHYFEMSKIDAKEALAIYRHFVGETERVVEYLGVAKKLQNLLNVPIPNLRHVRSSPCTNCVRIHLYNRHLFLSQER